MKIALIAVVLFLSLIPVMGASEITLTEQDASREVLLKKGELLVVRLPANPTTGYSWNLRISDKGILNQENADYHPSQNNGKRVGAGGEQYWKFRARKSGTTKLLFSYARPWEKGVPPSSQYQWNVMVK